MVVIEDELEGKLEAELSGWKQIVVLGIGSELSSDDSLGLLAAEKLKDALASIAGVKVFVTGSCPENFTGLLRRLSPTHVILLDAVEMGEGVGAIKLIDYHEIEEVMPSTHTLPLYALVKYVEQELGSKVLILGVQPKELSFGTALSEEVKNSVGKLVCLLKQIIVPLEKCEGDRFNGCSLSNF